MHERNLAAGHWHEEASLETIAQEIGPDRRREFWAFRYGQREDAAHAVQQALLVEEPPAICVCPHRRHLFTHALASLPRDQVGSSTGRLANVEREHEDLAGAKARQALYAHPADAVVVNKRDLRPTQMAAYVVYQAAEIGWQNDIVL